MLLFISIPHNYYLYHLISGWHPSALEYSCFCIFEGLSLSLFGKIKIGSMFYFNGNFRTTLAVVPICPSLYKNPKQYISLFVLQKLSVTNNNNHREGSYRDSGNSIGTFVSDTSEVRRSRGFPALGKALLRVKTGKRSTSAPNLGDGKISILPASYIPVH